ncbi:MAG: hypothetical protein CVT67_04660 [Actinobacteria bacterium HGW-Actinobacteria-7]|nr:MAG: hypothetical protein CVT67_04660 [Actinobacteria bacterium HGW-Actinobacteria-7]
MPEYRQDTHLPKRDADARRVESALAGWEQGVETLEAGYADEAIESYHWALDCRDDLQKETTSATFKQRTKIAGRLPELDRRFKAATVEAAGCVLSTRECDPVAEWWYFRVPASHPEWAESASE